MRKILLLPFSVLYAIGVGIRNFLFDKKINISIEFDLPIIGVGNLAIGGQGKTPMVEYLLELSKDIFNTGVLSRGYKRKSKGFKIVELSSSVQDSGDEPMQIKSKFPEAMVCVCEDRAMGIPLMLAEDELDLILLDDAYQHRWVKPGLNILLSDFNSPFFNDVILPSGNLRESKDAYQRADVIVFTRCSQFPDEGIQKKYFQHIEKFDKSNVFFSGLEYGTPKQFFSSEKKQKPLTELKNILLICGIAKPEYISDFLKSHGLKFQSVLFNDHHDFNDQDIKSIISTYKKLGDENAIIITTEKDAMRLKKFKSYFSGLENFVYTLPIKMKFNPEEKIRFDKIIFDFVRTKLHQNN